MFKKIASNLVLIAFLGLLMFFAFAAESYSGTTKVKGHTRKNGRRVHSYEKTKKNKSKTDNWSRRGSINPHTGKKGAKKY